jgi:hypothetical protein
MDNIVKIDFSRRIARDAASPPIGSILRPRRIARLSSEKTGLSETCRNGLLRAERDEVWRRADAIRDYWNACLKMEAAIARVQDLPERNNHPPHDPYQRFGMLKNYRQAIVQQLLTPAPTAAAVIWKKAAFAAGQHKYTDVKAERIERAIADDLAFFAAHPVRRSNGSNSEAMARKRKFNEAMRQRIREVAASRNLSEQEIKPALSLKHDKLVLFVEKYGINWPWMLEGVGRIFENDPIRLNANSSGEELAAVVATLPVADQQAIRATVSEILQERDQ